MKKIKCSKGITLIALIITIIVMMILVGVTVNIAIQGGLFRQAKDAVTKTEKQAILEQIIENTRWNNDGRVNVNQTLAKVVQQFGKDKVTPNTSEEGITEITIAVKGKKGTYNYKITTTEVNILEEEIGKEEIDKEVDLIPELKTYFTAESKTLVENAESFGETLESDLLSYPIYFSEYGAYYIDYQTDGYFYIYVEYDNKIYEVIYEGITETYSDIVYTGWDLDKEVNEYEGKYVYYDSDDDGTDEKWVVLYNENSEIQLLSMDNREYNIVNQIVTANDLDSSGTIDKIEKAVYFYNDIIKILNDAAATQITETTYKNSVRCLGTNPETPYIDDAGYWEKYNVWDLPKAKTNSISYPNYEFTIKKGDLNFEIDHKKVVCLNIPYLQYERLGEMTPFIYISRLSDYAYNTGILTPWIALHAPQNIMAGQSPIINHAATGTASNGGPFFYPASNSTVNYYPVVTLKTECSIDTSSGDGSLNNPYRITK